MCLNCVDTESLVYVCWKFWMYANLVGYVLSNQLVMLCVDDELLFLCLLCGFIRIGKLSVAQSCMYLLDDNNS